MPPSGLHKNRGGQRPGWAPVPLDKNFKQRYILIHRVIGPHCSSLFFLTHCNQGYTLVLGPWQPRNVQVQSKGNKNENLEKKKLRQT